MDIHIFVVTKCPSFGIIPLAWLSIVETYLGVKDRISSVKIQKYFPVLME